MKQSKMLILFMLPLLLILIGWGPRPSNEYEDNGFSFNLPTAYRLIETDLSDNLLVFSSPYSTLKVYTEKLKSTVSYQTYIEYGNYQLYLGKADFKVLANTTSNHNGYLIKQISYYRPTIENISDDQNYYLETHIINKKNNTVITFWATAPQVFYNNIKVDIEVAMQSFLEKQEVAKIPLLAPPVASSPHIKYQGRQVTLDIPSGKLLWGRFFPGVPFSENSYTNMLENEAKLNHKFEFIMTYSSFGNNLPFPERDIRKIYQDGRVLMLTLQPFTQDLNWIAVPEFIAGKHDTEIREWAKGLKKIGEPVFLRPLNEMNGDWDPWCAWFYGKDTDLYVLAWRHIVDIFREVKADNVLFVWNPHDRSYPDFTWNNPHLYYPGDEYVDWIGLTGYNNGTSHTADVWREFDEIYQPIYNDYLNRYPDKPFMITEFSCNETGGDKAQWIKAAMTSLAHKYPNIKIANWFDAKDKSWLYQLDSSPEAFEAFRGGLLYENFLKNSVQ